MTTPTSLSQAAAKASPDTANVPPESAPSPIETLPPGPALPEEEKSTLPPENVSATQPPTASEATARFETVPGYEILGELGRGGMGVVYKARQTNLNRLVALKMILAGGRAGEADLARFRTAGEAIARLQHPNIVQVYEVGEYQGKPFFSLEFCPGGSLDRKLDGTPLLPANGQAGRDAGPSHARRPPRGRLSNAASSDSGAWRRWSALR
jgi:serine/threonine protein kinase